ncbi:MAG: type III-A CRISPR-associated protein Cas10/Csm1 [Cytophagales bacterium]|nr:type III-A CRISPR-associated protein Cas10/Csm1 [Bernardetiaceae bacterium]MDW8205979.1 type III-A CRISPR-associated protein Cas10/Csm1 [Cytophagales bacterium]
MHIRESIYVAGLLHDIGKFYQRADDSGVKNSKLLSAETKNLESTFCPTDSRGGYTHKHVVWTYQFLKDFASNLKTAGFNWEEIATLAASHHKPNFDRIEQIILQKADQLASASDRSKAPEESEKADYKTQRLRLVFDFVKVPEQQQRSQNTTYVPLQKLSLKKSFVLREGSQNYRPEPAEYKTLWEAFTNEFKHVVQDNPNSFAETILSLLHIYTSTIPATTTDLPDVSLYDHSRVVAAMAICLYDWLQANGEDKSILTQSEHSPFLLLGGQISGIQSFIYNIIGRYAAKNLKGRSFYLELLCDDVISYILTELQLFSGNIIYNSGGNFYLLVPNTEAVRKKLEEIEYAIQAQLFVKHKTELAMVLATQPVSFKDLQDKQIATPWKQLFDKIGAKKSQKFRKVLNKNFSTLFEPQGGSKEDTQVDAITGDVIVGEVKYLDDAKSLAVGEYTYEQVSLGYHLKDAVALAEVNAHEPYFAKYAQEQKYPNICDPLREIGSAYYLIDKSGMEKITKSFKNQNGILKRIIGINQFDISLAQFENMQKSYPAWSFKLYGGNQFPVVTVLNKEGEEETEVKTFSEMAGMPEEDRNYKDFHESKFKRLGVLRMDVDNLGTIFSKGFEGEETLARFASLSRQMDLFFKGYLNTIRNNDEDFKNNLLILYAGGDDLFVVGNWASVIRFAKEVRESFRLFTNRNDITISGGVAILPAKFPIGKAALIAGEAEDKAKDFNNKAKNAICIFNEAISWDGEFAKVEELKTKMVRLRESNSLSASFLQQLMRFQMVKNRDKSLSYVWNAAYAIGRYKERTKNDATKDFLDTTQKYLFAGDTHTSRDRYFDLYAIAARWAELELR